MDTKLSMMPKYYTIKTIILDEIKAGIFKKGELIPSEKLLQEKYNVSRITVKRALDELAAEGYVNRIQGKGTYVQSDKTSAIPFSNKMISCSDEIRNINMVPSRKAISKQIENCTEEIAGILEVEPGTPVLHFSRIYYANHTPINFSDGYISLRDLQGLDNYDLEQNSLMHIIQNNYGLDITMVKGDAQAISADGILLDYLEIEKGFPLLKLDTLSCYEKEDGKHYCETVISYYRTDLLKVSML